MDGTDKLNINMNIFSGQSDTVTSVSLITLFSPSVNISPVHHVNIYFSAIDAG
jgi:hypothetical protein